MAQGLGVQEGRICPECGREDSVPLIWGLPLGGTMELAERGLVKLGGCMVPGEWPAFACRGCGSEWGSDDDPTADEQALADMLALPFPDVVGILGTGWRRADIGGGGVEWFVSGEPAQLAAGIDGPLLLLAPPPTGWSAQPSPDLTQVFSGGDLLFVPWVVAEAAEAIAFRRRRSFRWCRRCREVQPPESYVGSARMCEPCTRTEGLHPDDE